MLLTPDGPQNGAALWSRVEVDPCCLPPECFDICAVSCHLVAALPRGPMWDYQKAEAVERIQSRPVPFDLCLPLGCEERTCRGLADYAIYLAEFLGAVINATLWRNYKENDPFTAVADANLWLKRFGWENCYTRCQRVPKVTASDIQGDCGPIWCPPTLPPDLQRALDVGTLRAVARLQLGFIPNLQNLNWALEPLGVKVLPYFPKTDEFGDICEPENCCGMRWTVCPSDGFIDLPPEADSCVQAATVGRIPACVDQSCTKEPGQPDIVWPAVIVAECLVRAFLPECPDPLVDCDDPRWNTCPTVAPERPRPQPSPAFEECFPPEEVYDPTRVCGIERPRR